MSIFFCFFLFLWAFSFDSFMFVGALAWAKWIWSSSKFHSLPYLQWGSYMLEYFLLEFPQKFLLLCLIAIVYSYFVSYFIIIEGGLTFSKESFLLPSLSPFENAVPCGTWCSLNFVVFCLSSPPLLNWWCLLPS